MLSILVVEDNEDLRRSVCSYLIRRSYTALGAESANAAYDLLYKKQIDLVISDIMMPDIDGFEFAAALRKLNDNLPIIFMTARDDFESKQTGFRLGIDDYMVKPVNLDELNLRIQALLRRAHIASSKRLVIGDFILDADEHLAYYQKQPIELTTREFDLIFKLLSYPRRTFTRSQLMDEFWDVNSTASTRTVDVYMTKIREKLSDVPSFSIVTVRGLGYKAVPDEN